MMTSKAVHRRQQAQQAQTKLAKLYPQSSIEPFKLFGFIVQHSIEDSQSCFQNNFWCCGQLHLHLPATRPESEHWSSQLCYTDSHELTMVTAGMYCFCSTYIWAIFSHTSEKSAVASLTWANTSLLSFSRFLCAKIQPANRFQNIQYVASDESLNSAGEIIGQCVLLQP